MTFIVKCKLPATGVSGIVPTDIKNGSADRRLNRVTRPLADTDVENKASTSIATMNDIAILKRVAKKYMPTPEHQFRCLTTKFP
tara:strand:- start:187 stop:438 length:252 start_codon:yes stop_codon:yes gene_type:complete